MPGGSGQSHLFPLEYKNAKPIDLRADTPFTSPPLNDDFDAITHTHRWSRTTRATTVDPRASGLFDALEAVTRATTPVAAFSKPRRRKNKNQSTHGDADDKLPRKPTGELDDALTEEERGALGAHERSLRRMRGKDRIKASGTNGPTRMAPPAGQDYEMVEYQVLEEGPERTVSISTWREQAIQEADSDEEISVYFVNADDYVEATETSPVVEISALPRRTEENVASGSGSNDSGHRSKRSGESSGERRGAQNPAAERLTSTNGMAYTSLQLDPGTKTYRSASKMSLESSAPRTSTPRGSGTLIQALDTDTPGDISHTAKGWSPFHAKSKSGCTISSIHFTSTLDHILVSCEPSLIHILPVLQRVGIMSADHLRAVGKLSEATRNKEVREEVLKLGVTVMEWAILLDKLQSL
ncbi:hypothetical protein B0H19DRAFT_1110186 [Mycena capillaripes]|nr:hypothetical protein B0H19DRAFT_1110186 [Mycena capillaripes]